MEKGVINHSSFAFLLDFKGLYLTEGKKGNKGNKCFARHPSCSFFISSINPTAPAKLKANPIKEKGIRNGGEEVFEAQ